METDEGCLYESNAIAYYVAAAHKPELLGNGAFESALVQQYMGFADNELNGPIAAWYYPLAGYTPINEALMKKGKEDLIKSLTILDKILLPRTFLVGERITLADIVVVCTLFNVLGKLLEPVDREPLINLTRWFLTCVNQPEFMHVIGSFTLCTKTMEAAKPIVASTTVSGAAEKKLEEEEETSSQSGFNLENWKRFYSNNPVRPTGLTYFWGTFDPEGYSAWRVTYKYPESLKMIFMTCNLITGLFNRMDHLRKIAFGIMSIFGESNNNQIEGVFIFKGQELPAELMDVPDYESYTWTRMDLGQPKEKELLEDFFADEGKFNGIELAFNQSKEFK